jgi:hypothetical protein
LSPSAVKIHVNVSDPARLPLFVDLAMLIFHRPSIGSEATVAGSSYAGIFTWLPSCAEVDPPAAAIIPTTTIDSAMVRP